MDKYKKVSPKDPFAFPARLYNDLVDAARDSKKSKGFKNNATKHDTAYYIQNKTGKRLPIYSVVMVTDLAIDLPDSADEDSNLNALVGATLVFKGEIPDKNSKYFNKICITQEPLEIDGVGKGILDGITKCQIKRKENSIFSTNIKSFVSAEDQNTDTFLLTNYGNIELIYGSASNTETVYPAIVNMNSILVPSFFPVNLSWVSGGDSTSDYEPRIYNILVNNAVVKTNTDIAALNNPYRRPQDYNVTKATMGMAFCSSDGDILIAWANEYPLVGTAEVIP